LRGSFGLVDLCRGSRSVGVMMRESDQGDEEVVERFRYPWRLL